MKLDNVETGEPSILVNYLIRQVFKSISCLQITLYTYAEERKAFLVEISGKTDIQLLIYILKPEKFTGRKVVFRVEALFFPMHLTNVSLTHFFFK